MRLPFFCASPLVFKNSAAYEERRKGPGRRTTKGPDLKHEATKLSEVTKSSPANVMRLRGHRAPACGRRRVGEETRKRKLLAVQVELTFPRFFTHHRAKRGAVTAHALASV